MVSQDLAKEMAFEMRSKKEPLMQRASKRTFETDGRTLANSLKSTEFALFKDETEDKCGGQSPQRCRCVVFMPLCIPFLLSVGGSYGLLLMNRIQKI